MAAQQTILVTGSNGQLGSELQTFAPSYPQYDFTFLTREQFSLDDNEQMKAAIADHQPTYVINCAAYTAVDKAESEKDAAYQANATAVSVMAKACRNVSARFIHISTDYVFDGTSREPLKEDDAVSPINVYGETKLKGEQQAIEEAPDCIIIRTSWVYSSHGKNFVKTMLRLMGERETVSVVGDQWGSPTYAADLAEAILQIISGGNWQPGIYHYSNDGVISWAQFAEAIAEQSGAACAVQSIPTSGYPTPAARPAYSVMNKAKIAATFSIPIKPWKEGLAACIRLLQSQ